MVFLHRWITESRVTGIKEERLTEKERQTEKETEKERERGCDVDQTSNSQWHTNQTEALLDFIVEVLNEKTK